MILPESLRTSSHSQGLSQLADALEAGRVQAATDVFRDMAEQSTDLLLLGSEIAEILDTLYDDLNVNNLNAFVTWLRQFPADEATDAALHELSEPLNLAEDWLVDLRDLANERVARQIRQKVRDRDISAAARASMQYLLRDNPKGDRKRHRLRQLATILGTLGHDRTRAMKVADSICKEKSQANMSSEDCNFFLEEIGKTQASLSLSEMGEYERQWNQMHTQCVVKLMRRLPGPGAENAKPTPDDERRFYDSLHALMAAYFMDCGDDIDSETSRDRLQDIVRILKEFCPADEREIGPVEGVEDVAFLRMGAGDRLVSVRGLRKLGENERLVQTMLDAIHKKGKGRSAENLLYLMGGLSNERFFPFLAAALRDKNHASMHPTIVDALGRIGNDEALALLEDRLVELTGKKVLESSQQRRVMNVIRALSRIARSPRTNSQLRDSIVEHILNRLPEDRNIQMDSLRSICSWNPAGLSEENRKRIVAIAVDSLWTLDRASSLQESNGGQRSDLGFREEIANILIDMGKPVLPFVIEEAERRALHYSGAFRAMADILAQIGNQTAIPFLERILTVTLRTDDEAIPDHLREKYYDTGRDMVLPLTRDKIAHDIIYTINRIGGKQADRILQHTADLIKSKEYDHPGDKTMDLIAEILVEKGLASDDKAEEDSPTPMGMRHKDIKGSMPAAPAPPSGGPRPRADDTINTLIKDVRGGLLFKKKMPQRISAIQELAARGDLDGIPALIDALEDGNKLVSSAAEAGLSRILNPQSTSPDILRHRLYEVLEGMRKAKPPRVQAIRRVIDKLRPERDPLKQMLLGFVHVEPDENMKRKIASIFRTAQERLTRSGEAVEFPEFNVGAKRKPNATRPVIEGAEDTGDSTIAASNEPASHTDLVDAKHAYFQARREWIAGGKQGPEPPRPPGV